MDVGGLRCLFMNDSLVWLIYEWIRAHLRNYTHETFSAAALETILGLCATHSRLYFIIYAESPCWRSMLALKLRKSIKLPTTMTADNSSSSCSLHRQLYRFFLRFFLDDFSFALNNLITISISTKFALLFVQLLLISSLFLSFFITNHITTHANQANKQNKRKIKLRNDLRSIFTSLLPLGTV